MLFIILPVYGNEDINISRNNIIKMSSMRCTMKKVLVSGFYQDYLLDAIINLEKEEVISVKEWIVGDQDSPVTHPNRVWWWDIVYKEQVISSAFLTDQETDYLMSKYHFFEQQIVREKIFELDTPHEVHNIIFKFIYHFKKIICSSSINAVLFSDVPHGAYDVILYNVAKMMNVKTLFCMSSFWPGESFLLEDLNDIGKFKVDVNNYRVSLDRKYEKRLPYMDKPNIKDKIIKKTKLFFDFRHYIQDKKSTFKRNKLIYGGVRNYLLKHCERFIKRNIEKNTYKSMYKNFFNDSIKSNERFVYFPLHLQPEMTTDTLGGFYYDQVLAIEKLRTILPEDWYIYVKENPLQTYYMRGRRFFERLKSLHNIRLISKNVDTYDLMSKSEFVATITGTAGWEAISGGKNTLVFGYAWYRYLNGVSIYRDDITAGEILANEINFDILEREVYALKAATHKFSCEKYYKDLSNMTDEENIRNLEDSLRSLFG